MQPLATVETALQELVGHALEPLEALLESLMPKPGEKRGEGERARLLFHVRFALGFLLLAKGDKDRAQTLLHDMAATKFAVRGNVVRGGPRVVPYTPDLGAAKWLTALMIEMNRVYAGEQDYGETLFLITEAADSDHPLAFVLPRMAVQVLDLWAAQCETVDASHEYDSPDLNWLDLFAAAGDILAACHWDDSSVELPNECSKGSAQFQAWHFGQLAARFAYTDDRWREDLFTKLRGPEDYIFSGDLEEAQADKLWGVLTVLSALLSECEPGRNWEAQRQRYVGMWQSCARFLGMALPEIGPECDLYWAMRVGFADKMLELAAQEGLVHVGTVSQSATKDIETIKDITSSAALRGVRIEELLNRRLPPTPSEVRQELAQQLGNVWAQLPASVVNHLVKAEQNYRSEVEDNLAKVAFHKAVEACFAHCFLEPLISLMQRRDERRIQVPFPPPRGTEWRNVSGLRKVSLLEWADALEVLASATQPQKSLASLGANDLKESLQTLFTETIFSVLPSLASSLREFSRERKDAAHHPSATSRYETERQELEQMRNLVLGTKKPSIITQIFQVFPPQQ